MPSQPVLRYHSLDALRAAMMLLGLVLHSAANYTYTPLGPAWPYQDRQTSVVFDLVLFFIHLFRMPVFFVIAGFFAALLYDRDGLVRFARNRAARVLLPLALFWPIAVPPAGLGFVFALRQGGNPVPWNDLVAGSLLEAPILGHLWFLYDLLLLYAASAVLAPMAARLPAVFAQSADVLFRAVATKTWGVVILAGVTLVTLLPMEAPALDTSGALLPPIRILAAYGVFFAFGWLLFRQREVIPSYRTRWASLLGAGICASVGYLVFVVRRPIVDPAMWHLVAVSLAALSIWLFVLGSIGLFVRHMDTPRPLVRYFSDASYWMYVTHLVPVIWTAGVLARSTAPAVMKFAVVLAFTTFVTTVSYHYIVRSTAIGQLLNGRRYPRSGPLPAPASIGG
jgi:surface polysaccharide O-acyltransferase-like enzyme